MAESGMTNPNSGVTSVLQTAQPLPSIAAEARRGSSQNRHPPFEYRVFRGAERAEGHQGQQE